MARLTIFVHLAATAEWLRLSRAERGRVVRDDVGPLLANHPGVALAFYDAEAFTAACSDITVFETDTLDEYAALMDGLRESPLFAVPYFRVVGIYPTRLADFV